MLMEKGNIVKVSIIVVALGAAGYLGWKNMTKPLDGVDEMNTAIQWFKASDGREFSLTAGEARKSATANNGIVLDPVSGKPATEMFKCPNTSCGKLLELVGHGQHPETCTHCKAKLDNLGNVISGGK
jgi:hypothetical protein